MRWQLNLWHAAILVLAVAGIGVSSFFTIQQSRYHEIDSELEAAGQVLNGKLHGPQPPRRGDPRPGFENGSRPGNQPGDGPGDNRPENAAPPRDGDQGSPGGQPGDGFQSNDGGRQPPDEFDPLHLGPMFRPDRLPRQIELPPGFLQRYGGTDLDARSFVIYRDTGHGGPKIVKQWGFLVDAVDLPPSGLRPKSTNATAMYEHDEFHDVLLAGPENTTLLVRGSIQGVTNELRRLIWRLAGAGAGIVAIGLLGGWAISKLAIRPIGRMSELAGSISATHLGGRINPRMVPSELTQLAMVLNGTFQRLEQAFAQQARFTADASHELRTPLTVVLTNSELALSRERSPEEYRSTLEKCFSAAVRMKSLVESLLLLSHADVGELSLRPVQMDLSDVARENVNLLTTLAGQLQSATLIGDPFRIGQVLANLLSNAIRYNRDGGSITVTTEVLLGDAVLSVADTGAGISVEDQQQVFNRFFRADKARSRVAGGSGLGLAICKSIVEAHGGSIEVTSELGVGTTFLVRLPRGNAETIAPALPVRIDLDSPEE
jgi:heavy metal sensor kinase